MFMKSYIVVAFLSIGSICFAGATDKLPVEKIVKYEKNPELSIKIPTDFAKEYLVTPTLLDQIKGKKIFHIDLVYTSFKKSKDFDQTALNDRRILQLKKELPQIISDKPSWKLIEQEGAKTAEEAHLYFHGFVIYFSDDLDYKDLNAFFSGFEIPSTKYILSNNESKDLVYSSGTIINVPKNAVKYSNGNLVKGEYEFFYKEFRNPAEIIFSGIPMKYSSGGTEYNFNSVGMYEISAQQNGVELELSKPVIVNFNCTKQEEGVDFYQLNSKTEQWKKIKEIEFEVKMIEKEEKRQFVEVEFGVRPEGAVFANIQEQNWEWTFQNIGNEISVIFNMPSWIDVKANVEKDKEWALKVKSTNQEKREMRINTKDSLDFQKFISDCNLKAVHLNFIFNNEPKGNDMNATLLASGADAGHTYPTIVKGLNSPKFGVYNCDQIYRIGQAKNLTPNYIDATSRKEITGKHVTCVIDLNYNGAFSFHPNNVTCDLKGKNVILLFTNDKKVYMLSEKEFNLAILSNDTYPEFRMTEISDQIKSSDDLKKLLNL